MLALEVCCEAARTQSEMPELNRPKQQGVAHIEAHRHDRVDRREVGVEPICAVPKNAGVQVAPSGYCTARSTVQRATRTPSRFSSAWLFLAPVRFEASSCCDRCVDLTVAVQGLIRRQTPVSRLQLSITPQPRHVRLIGCGGRPASVEGGCTPPAPGLLTYGCVPDLWLLLLLSPRRRRCGAPFARTLRRSPRVPSVRHRDTSGRGRCRARVGRQR